MVEVDYRWKTLLKTIGKGGELLEILLFISLNNAAFIDFSLWIEWQLKLVQWPMVCIEECLRIGWSDNYVDNITHYNRRASIASLKTSQTTKLFTLKATNKIFLFQEKIETMRIRTYTSLFGLLASGRLPRDFISRLHSDVSIKLLLAVLMLVWPFSIWSLSWRLTQASGLLYWNSLNSWGISLTIGTKPIGSWLKSFKHTTVTVSDLIKLWLWCSQ